MNALHSLCVLIWRGNWTQRKRYRAYVQRWSVCTEMKRVPRDGVCVQRWSVYTGMECVYRDGVCVQKWSVCTEMELCTEWNVCIEVEDVCRDRTCVQRWNVCVWSMNVGMKCVYRVGVCIQIWSVYRGRAKWRWPRVSCQSRGEDPEETTVAESLDHDLL